MSLYELITIAIREDKKVILDDLYLLAWIWAKEDESGKTNLLSLYNYLLKHSTPESVMREKRKYLDSHPDEKERGVSTIELKREMEGQSDLWEIGKKYLSELRGKR